MASTRVGTTATGTVTASTTRAGGADA
jgi:hypothetical protein